MNKLSLVILAILALTSISGLAQENRSTTNQRVVRKTERQQGGLFRNIFGSNPAQTTSQQSPRQQSNAIRSNSATQVYNSAPGQQIQQQVRSQPSRYSQHQPSQQHNHQQVQRQGVVSGAQISSASSAEELSRASTTRESALEAMHKIPWNKIGGAERQKIESVVSNYTLFRRLPMAGGFCNPELFDYFLSYPETVVALWENLGYTQIAMKRVSRNQFTINDSGGTTGSIEILYQDSELLLAYCRGGYRGPIGNRKLEGEIVFLLQTRYTEDKNRQPISICRADSFVRINNIGADLVGRVFAPALGKIADTNFEQTVSFLCSMSDWSEKAPLEVVEKIPQLKNIHQTARTILYTKVQRTYEQKLMREQGQIAQYEIMPKLNQPEQQTARLLARDSDASGLPSDLTQSGNGQYDMPSTNTSSKMEASRSYYEKSITSPQLRNDLDFTLNKEPNDNKMYRQPEKAEQNLSEIQDLPVISFAETSMRSIASNETIVPDEENAQDNTNTVLNTNTESKVKVSIPDKMVIKPFSSKGKASSAFKSLALTSSDSEETESLQKTNMHLQSESSASHQQKTKQLNHLPVVSVAIPEIKTTPSSTTPSIATKSVETKSIATKSVETKNVVVDNKAGNEVSTSHKEQIAQTQNKLTLEDNKLAENKKSSLPVLTLPTGMVSSTKSSTETVTAKEKSSADDSPKPVNNGWRVVR